MNYYCCLARSLRCGSKMPLENVQIGRIFQDYKRAKLLNFLITPWDGTDAVSRKFSSFMRLINILNVALYIINNWVIAMGPHKIKDHFCKNF